MTQKAASKSLRGHFAVTTQLLSRLQRGYFAVTTRSLRGHYGHYAVTTRSLRSLRGHYGHYAIRKSTCSRLRKRSTSLQNGLFDRDIVAVLISSLLQNGFIIPQIGFKFDSIKRSFNNASCLPQQCLKVGVKPGDSRNETGQQPERNRAATGIGHAASA